MNKPDLSIVVPYHNEGLPFILETIQSIRDTIDVSHELILVDDCSSKPLGNIEGVQILRHKQNLGVGQAFNTGVAEAKSDNLFLMGSDIRFLPNQWASKSIEEANKHPKAYTCTTCVGLNRESPEGMDINIRKNRSRRNGANILIFHDHKTHPKKPSNFRSILEAQWLPLYRGEAMDSFEVPCILGAAYVVKKEWYEYTEPWIFHRSWGTLEPEVSLRSWLFGGSCRTAPDIQCGHIFKRDGVHGTPLHHLTYNKLQCATLLFDDYDTQRLIDFLGHNPQVANAKKMFEEVKGAILTKKEEYRNKIVYDIRDYVKRFQIDFRENA